MPVKHWEQYQHLLNFMRQDGIMENSKVNERVYSGDQWFHVSKANQLPKIIINYYKRSANFLISAVTGGETKIQYTVEPYLADDPEQIERYNQAEDIFNRYSESAFEQIGQDELDEMMVKDALLSGIGIIHYYWDDEYETGNDIKIKGKVVGEIIDAVNFFPADPTITDIQSQEKIHLTYRDSIANIKAEAKANKLEASKIEMITPDTDTQDQAFVKAQQEVTGSEKATVLLTYYKKDGKVYFDKSVKNVTFAEGKNTKRPSYPLCYMNGEWRKRSIYGTSPFTEIVPNQIYVNTLYSMAMVSAQKTSYPTAVYDSTRISGISNAVGAQIGVQGDVTGAFTYANTGQISFDVYNLVDNVMSKTKESVGANDALLGNVKPENTSALLVNQQQSSIPLESIQRRFYKAKEQQGRILCEFWQAQYVIDRPIELKNDNGEREIIKFNSEDYADIKMRTTIDVGAASKWSEIIAINTLNEWLQAQHIEFIDALERFPQNIIPKMQELIDKYKPVEPMEMSDNEYEKMAQFLESLPSEQQQQIMSLPPGEQEQAIIQMMGGMQNEMQPMQTTANGVQF